MAKKGKRYGGVYSVEGKNGISYGIDYVHPQTGKRVKKIIKGCSSEQEAAEIRSVEVADAARGALEKSYGLKPSGPAILFDDMIDEYLKYWSKPNKDHDTDTHRAKPLRRAFARKLMTDITPWGVERFKIQEAKSSSKNTVNKVLSLGSQIFEKAKEWGKYKGQNPFWEVKRFKIARKKKPGSLSPEQVEAIMTEIRHEVKRDMVEFAFNTGWRISEITGLKWEDCDLEAGSAWLVDPKNKETVEIELNDRALQIIQGQGRNGEYVFCHKNGKQYKTSLNKVFKNAAERAGVYLPPRKAWHILRRTWASMFLQAGGDVETLRVLGNWKDHSMPMWYADAAGRAHKKRVLNKLPKLNGRNMEEVAEVVSING